MLSLPVCAFRSITTMQDLEREGGYSKWCTTDALKRYRLAWN